VASSWMSYRHSVTANISMILLCHISIRYRPALARTRAAPLAALRTGWPYASRQDGAPLRGNNSGAWKEHAEGDDGARKSDII